MSATTPADRCLSGSLLARPRANEPRLQPLDILILSAWCGLAGGLLEVWARIVGTTYLSSIHFYLLSRHFLWLAPLSNLLFVSLLGLLLAFAARRWPRFGRWFGPRVIAFLSILPVVSLLGPRIYPAAWAVFALGAALCLASFLEQHEPVLRRRMLVSFPGLLCIALILAGSVCWSEWLARRNESSRPLPPGNPPNILLITLDTVGANHLSLYGYSRPTSPVLERLAGSGIRFDQARATAPWTLPSHATMFTSRWHHDLNVDWSTPLDKKHRTLAEHLGSHGYATAGFVANLFSCAYDSGLNRGFNHYEDYVLEYLVPFRTAWLVEHFTRFLSDLVTVVGPSFGEVPYRILSHLSPYLVGYLKKDGASINRDFLNWLSHRPHPGRPFFAFLNYFDAHHPYVLPTGARYRFGVKPVKPADFVFLGTYWDVVDKLTLRPVFRTLGRDSYDNCVAYLDERLGDLIDELQRRGIFDHTLLIVTSDHGEGMGEHDLFAHGESLYQPEIHVPLVIVLPVGARENAIVREPVSLRDLPATILDLAGLNDRSPFLGRSLANLWRNRSAADSPVGEAVISELLSANPSNPNRGRSPALRGPLVSLAEGDLVYIRNLGDGSEELFNVQEDPGEIRNLIRAEAMQPVIERIRQRLDSMK